MTRRRRKPTTAGEGAASPATPITDATVDLRTRVDGPAETTRALSESEELYQQLFEAASDAIFLIDNEAGRILEANRAAVAMYGYSRSELLALTNADLSAEPEATQAVTHGTPVVADNVVTIPLRIHRKKDGSTFPVEITGRFFVRDGRAVHMAAIRDVTERKQLELGLGRSESRYRELVHAMSSAVVVYEAAPDGQDFVIREFNTAAERIEQVAAADVIGRPVTDVFAGVEAFGLLDVLRKVSATGSPMHFPVALYADGRLSGWRENDVYRLPGGEVVAVYEDVGERVAAEHALARAKELLERTQAISKVGGWEYDVATEHLAWTDEVYRIHGVDHSFDPNDIGADIGFYSPESRSIVREAFRRAAADGEAYDLEVELIRADGERIWVRTIGQPVSANGAMVRVTGTIIDITERKRAQDAASASAANYYKLFHTTLNGMAHCEIVLDEQERPVDYRFLQVNAAFESQTGLRKEEVEGRTVCEIIPGFEKSAFDFIGVHGKVALTGEETQFEQYQENLQRWYSVHLYSPRKGHFISMFSDITARKQAEQQLASALTEWRTTFDAMTDSVTLFDKEGRVLRCNAATTALTGRGFDDIVGRPCFEVFHGTATFHPDCPQRRALASGQVEVSFMEQSGHWLRISFTPLTDAEGRISGGVHVVTDVSELKQAEEGLREGLAAQQATTRGVITALAHTIEVRDPYTAGHQRRVSELGVVMARHMELGDDRVEGVRVAGMLHDVGKVNIPAEILSKPGRLTTIEFELIKRHSEAAYEILLPIPFPWPVAEVALQHHERQDGSGYPAGLIGEEILVEARILAIADVVEAMASHRPYRPALGVATALDEVRSGAGMRYDAGAVKACERAFDQGFDFSES